MSLQNTQNCWFFNNGTCKRSADECAFAHVKGPARKPLYFQRPCKSLHFSKKCRFGTKCRFDHFELTAEEWEFHFTDSYPGVGYLVPKVAPPPATNAWSRLAQACKSSPGDSIEYVQGMLTKLNLDNCQIKELPSTIRLSSRLLQEGDSWADADEPDDEYYNNLYQSILA